MKIEYDTETKTKSLLAAAHLAVLGYPVTRVLMPRDSGQPFFCFSPAARDTLRAFYEARDQILASLPNGGTRDGS